MFASHSTNPVLNGSEVTLAPGAFAIYGTKEISAGIDGITDDMTPAVNVKGGIGEIIVEGDYDYMNVYTLTGAITSNENLAPGIYIVIVDGVSHKVVVR